MSKEIHGYAVRRRLAAARIRVQQLEWLVTQLPILNAPDADADVLNRLARATSQYAYVNPKTWQKLMRSAEQPTCGWTKIKSTCPTKFVITELIPEGGMLFTPHKMPGVDGL
jgi:hypothetical protein